MDNLDDVSVATSLSDAVKNHPTLDTLVFVQCGLNNADILEIILEGCTRNGSRSSSEESRIRGCCSIGRLYTQQPSYKVDSIEGIQLTDNDALLLASALKKNTNLRRVESEQNNDITDEGEKTLLNAVFDPTSMDSIVESNHTCMAYTHDINKP